MLGIGVNSSPLWTEVPSYAVFGVRFGMRFGPHAIVIDAEISTTRAIVGSAGAWTAPGAVSALGIPYRSIERLGDWVIGRLQWVIG